MRKNGFSDPLNIVTIVVLLITFCICGYYASLLVNPNTPSPFVKRLPTRIILATLPPPTETPFILPTLGPSPTPTVEAVVPEDGPTEAPPTDEAISGPTEEPIPTRIGGDGGDGGDEPPPTPIGGDGGDEPIPTPIGGDGGDEPPPTPIGGDGGNGGELTPISLFTYQLQSTPTLTSHTTQGCDWMGVAGLVFDANGDGVTGIALQIEGPGVSETAFSGTAIQYGDSGYEVQIGEAPAASSGEFSIVVLDDNGDPASETIFFDTSANCEENLTLVTFEEIS